jgi:hypothetical protein
MCNADLNVEAFLSIMMVRCSARLDLALLLLMAMEGHLLIRWLVRRM